MTEQTADLDTIEGVTERISQVIWASNPRDLKTAERRARAGHLADLHEIRARLWAEMDLSPVPSNMLRDLAKAVEQAAMLDANSVKFWRTEASAR